MRSQAALAIIGLAISICACGGEGATAPVAPAPAVDLKSSLSTSFDALAILANAACSISISQHGQVVLERGLTHSRLLDTYSSFTVIFPADRSSVVVLCNFDSNSLANFVTGIRSIMLSH
jgi:hypothetical protein